VAIHSVRINNIANSALPVFAEIIEQKRRATIIPTVAANQITAAKNKMERR
jgi:hypothetical protein